jgi:hypothetical protein
MLLEFFFGSLRFTYKSDHEMALCYGSKVLSVVFTKFCPYNYAEIHASRLNPHTFIYEPFLVYFSLFCKK